MNENGKWSHYPHLKQVSFDILKLWEQGLSQKDIREMAKNKEIGDPPLSAQSVDRLYLELVQLKLIKKTENHIVGIVKKKFHTQLMRDVKNVNLGLFVIVELVIVKTQKGKNEDTNR